MSRFGLAVTGTRRVMSTPEIDPVTAESEQEDEDFGAEHTEPTFRDQPPGTYEGGDDEISRGDSGGLKQDG